MESRYNHYVFNEIITKLECSNLKESLIKLVPKNCKLCVHVALPEHHVEWFPIPCAERKITEEHNDMNK